MTDLAPQFRIAELQARAGAAARLLKLMANEQRLQLLCRLADGEAPVGELAACVGLTASATSQHLARMRAENLVATRRDAQTIFYRLADPAAERVLETLCNVFGGPAHGGR